MSISCACDFDASDHEEWFHYPTGTEVHSGKRSCRCWACGDKIMPGQIMAPVPHFRRPLNDIEERISGEEVALAPRRLCADCYAMASAIIKHDMCIDLSSPIDEQIIEAIEEMENQERLYGESDECARFVPALGEVIFNLFQANYPRENQAEAA